MTSHFPGFPTEAIQFLADLADNNNRDWFEAHKKEFKRVPGGFAADHPRADLLRHNALYAHPRWELDIKTVTSPQLVETCLTHFAAMAPIQQWLVKVINA